jgi:hypothetical protein
MEFQFIKSLPSSININCSLITAVRSQISFLPPTTRSLKLLAYHSSLLTCVPTTRSLKLLAHHSSRSFNCSLITAVATPLLAHHSSRCSNCSLTTAVAHTRSSFSPEKKSTSLLLKLLAHHSSRSLLLKLLAHHSSRSFSQLLVFYGFPQLHFASFPA